MFDITFRAHFGAVVFDSLSSSGKMEKLGEHRGTEIFAEWNFHIVPRTSWSTVMIFKHVSPPRITKFLVVERNEVHQFLEYEGEKI